LGVSQLKSKLRAKRSCEIRRLWEGYERKEKEEEKRRKGKK
jgi:hypothetical protein